MKILRQILWVFVYALPAVLFFSYYPVITLGASESMNYELSLPLIWLVLFDILALIYAILLHLSHRRPLQTGKHSPVKSTQRSQKSVVATSDQHSRQQVVAKPPQYSKKHSPTKPARHNSDHLAPNPNDSADSAEHLTNWGYNFPGISDRRFFLFTLFPLYATISVFWSANPVRGILTAGIMWLIFFAVFAILYVLPQGGQPRRLRTHVLLVFFVATFLVCKYCYAQSIMDVFGVSRDNTLLCAGCTYRSFGFPHPSGFAIEPQFMGNLLLAPALTALYMVVFRPRRFAQSIISDATAIETKVEQKLLFGKIKLPRINWQKWQHIGMILLAIDFATALFFTFSRGAIYAFGVAILIMLGFAIKRKTFRWSLITIPVVSFLLSLTLQGTLAAVGPTAETFTSAIAKSIHQLSLGVIDLRTAFDDTIKETERSLTEKNPTAPVENSTNSVDKNTQNVQNSQAECGKTLENYHPSSGNQVEKSHPSVENPATDCAELVQNSDSNGENSANSVDKNSQTVEKPDTNCGKDVQNSSQNVDNSTADCGELVKKTSKPVEDIAEIVDKEVEKHEEKSTEKAEKTLEDAIFEGYVAESTNIRLNLNKFAFRTWLAAPNRQGTFPLEFSCDNSDDSDCNISTKLTPTSVLFGVGLGGAGVAMFQAFPDELGSPKEIVQNEPFSLLLETGLVGIALVIFSLLLAFFPNIFSRKFLDGRSALDMQPNPQSSSSVALNVSIKSTPITTGLPSFWRHPALPLLASLTIAYVITLNFFSGLPNALQIYLMPPLLYLIFANVTRF